MAKVGVRGGRRGHVRSRCIRTRARLGVTLAYAVGVLARVGRPDGDGLRATGGRTAP